MKTVLQIQLNRLTYTTEGNNIESVAENQIDKSLFKNLNLFRKIKTILQI